MGLDLIGEEVVNGGCLAEAISSENFNGSRRGCQVVGVPSTASNPFWICCRQVVFPAPAQPRMA